MKSKDAREKYCLKIYAQKKVVMVEWRKKNIFFGESKQVFQYNQNKKNV